MHHQKNIHRKLTEHIQKRDIIKQAGGYTSSVEREIRTYQSQLNADRKSTRLNSSH